MEKIPISIREEEVLRHLRFNPVKNELDPKLSKIVRESIRRGLVLIKQKVKYKIVDIVKTNEKKVVCQNFVIESCAVAKLLFNSTKAVVFMTTIGPDLEKEIAKLFQKDEPTKAVILDAVGSEAVEAMTDNFQSKLMSQNKGYLATVRFSPGYGDWNIRANKKILTLLKAGKMGIKISSKYMLSPQKTITGVWGLVRS